MRLLCTAHSPVVNVSGHAAGPTLETDDIVEAVAFFIRWAPHYRNCTIARVNEPLPEYRGGPKQFLAPGESWEGEVDEPEA